MNQVIVYSHFFTVQNPEIELRKILYTVAADYTVFGMVFDEARRKRVWKPTKTFGFYTKLNDEFRFHIGQLGRMTQAAAAKGIQLDIYHMPLYEPCKEVYKVQEKFVLRADQEEAADFILDNSHEGSHAPLLSMPMGSGKALAVGTPVLTPTGWMAIESLRVGDPIYAYDGSVCRVTGVYPQGITDLNRVTFEDGRSILASGDHLWAVYDDPVLTEGSVQTTDQIKLQLELQYSPEFYIDLFKAGGDYAKANNDLFQKFIAYTRQWRCAFPVKTGRCVPGVTVALNVPAKTELIQDIVTTAWGVGWTSHIAPRGVDGNILIILKKPTYGKLKLVSVEPMPPTETVCIAIDHASKLFVVDNYIVTHNTVTSLVAASRLGNRLSVSVLAGYVEKWVGDLESTYEIDKKDIYRIEGGDSLIDYCQHVLENQSTPEKLPKATVISLNTIGRWYKRYMEDPFDPVLNVYGMKPWELMEKAGIGTNIFDESHQHLHAVYRMFCFLHVPKTISLSATLTSEDETELRIQRMMYPRHKRFEKIKMKRYITVYACQYQIQDYANSRVRTTEYGSNNYSHTAFEKSILSQSSMKSQYVNMIVRMVAGSFANTSQPGDKCAVFVSSHAMAKEVCKAIHRELPDFDTRTYLESDPIENLMDSDIRVTTVLSGGTAHDIKGLTVSIQTINLNSIKSNLQVLGRLREIPGRDIRFYYLYCSSIPKHIEYHRNKIEMFQDWCKERKDLMLDTLVPNKQAHLSHFKRY